MSYGNCEKKHRTVASFTTNVNDPATSSWDLTPYKTAGIGTPGGTWRLIEVGYNLLYESGKISSDGTLVSYDYEEPVASGVSTFRTRSSTPSSLPDHFDSHYSYDGYMELQITDPDDECTTCPCPEHE